MISIIVGKSILIYLSISNITKVSYVTLINIGNMKNLSLLFIFLFTFYSCQETDQNDYLSLSEAEIALDHEQSEKKLKITSSSEWTLSEIPDWCVIDYISGKSSMIINITIRANQTYSNREANIKIANQNSVQYLYIRQSGIERQENLTWQTFPVNSIDFTADTDNIKYNFRSSEIFINAHISEKIYPGNIISSNSTSNDIINEFKDYQYNPISISIIGGKFYSDIIIPSKLALNKFVNKAIQETSTQNQSFNYSTPIFYHSYKQLYLLSYANVAEDFCKLITNKNYNETKMGKGVGLIYTYKLQCFRVQMDYPEKLIKDNLSNDFIHENNLAYVASVSYGKTAYLIIESDYDKILTNGIIQKIMNEEQLSVEQQAIFNSLDVYYLYYTSDGILKRGNTTDKKGSVLAYKKSINENEIMPISFTLNDFLKHSVKSLNYSLDLI